MGRVRLAMKMGKKARAVRMKLNLAGVAPGDLRTNNSIKAIIAAIHDQTWDANVEEHHIEMSMARVLGRRLTSATMEPEIVVPTYNQVGDGLENVQSNLEQEAEAGLASSLQRRLEEEGVDVGGLAITSKGMTLDNAQDPGPSTADGNNDDNTKVPDQSSADGNNIPVLSPAVDASESEDGSKKAVGCMGALVFLALVIVLQ